METTLEQTKEQTLRTLDQLGTFVITKKKVSEEKQMAFSDDVLKTVSLYKKKASKADMPSQFADFIEAAKHELKELYDKYQQA